MNTNLNFKLSPQADFNVRLVQKEPKGVLVKNNWFKCLHTLTRCEKNNNGQSALGVILYVFTLCLNFGIGYSIYRAQDIDQDKLSNVELFGDIAMVAFLAFCIINFSWHSFEALTCLGKKCCTRPFYAGILRYLGFVGSMLGSTVVYGRIRDIPFFQTSLNSDLSDKQWWAYFGVFSVVFGIIVYWCVKLFDFEFTRRCCRPKYINRLVFVRLLLAIVLVNVLSYFVCAAASDCDYHLHHSHFGLCLVVLSTPLVDNWLDIVLQGVFWMFLLESQWNYSVRIDQFFI